MAYYVTRAFCEECRLHFEYALVDLDVEEQVIVPCPRCGLPARHGTFQECNMKRFLSVEASYERLAEGNDPKRRKKRDRRRERDEMDWEEEEFFSAPKHRKHRR